MPKTALPRALELVDAGLITRPALISGRVHDDLADRLVRQGRWTRLAPSVLLPSDRPPTDAQLVEAARLHAGKDVVVTGAVACRALGLPYAPKERVAEVIIAPGTRVVSSPYVLVHQSDRETPTGRLPPFLLNPTLLVDGQRVGAPDGWVVGTGVGWQVDNREFHAEQDDFDTTLAVHDGFAEHGLTLLHVTPRRLRRLGPAWVELLVAAVAARPPGGGEPPRLTLRGDGPLQTGRGGRRPLPAAHVG